MQIPFIAKKTQSFVNKYFFILKPAIRCDKGSKNDKMNDYIQPVN